MMTMPPIRKIYILPCSGMWDLSSPARNRTHVPAVEAWHPNYWTTREFCLKNIFNVIRKWFMQCYWKKVEYLCISAHRYKEGNVTREFGRNGGIIMYEWGLLLCIFFFWIASMYLCMLLKNKTKNPHKKATYSIWWQLCICMH